MIAISGDTEADTCRKYVLPNLYAAGWTDGQISEQRYFTDGRIVVAGSKVKRRPQKRADYLLRYSRDFPLAVVEAKVAYKRAGDGLQQAKEYGDILGLKFAYAANGQGIVEHDFLTGHDNELEAFPSPADLWARLRAAQGISDQIADRLLTPYYHLSGKTPRYYQEHRHQPGGAGHSPREAPCSADPRHRDRENGGGISDLLEALEFALEPDG